MIAKPRTKEQISYTMSRIKGKDTGIEVALRMELRRRHLHYRKNVANLPGKPDIVFAQHKIAIFCDGEFWHGRNWAERKGDFRRNKSFWIEKIERNMARDRKVNRSLRALGWKVIRIWESDIKKDVRKCGAKIEDALVSGILRQLRLTENARHDMGSP